MIQKISKITLYVENQSAAKSFWVDKIGFVVSLEQPMGEDMTWLEVSPKQNSETSFVIYEKNWMHMQNPDISTSHPSVILSSDDITDVYNKLKNNGVKVTELMNFPYGSMFTFFDNDNNSYLIREDK